MGLTLVSGLGADMLTVSGRDFSSGVLMLTASSSNTMTVEQRGSDCCSLLKLL